MSHILLLGLVVFSWTTMAAPEVALSPRNANYTIEATLDTEARTISGREVVEWRNVQEHPTDELWFHLYWNAWRNNRSTWMLEDRIAGRSRRRGRKVRGKDAWSWVEVDSVRLLDARADAGRELPRRFASPDDANPDDRTVFIVSLPEEILPGQSVRVEVAWRAKIPRTFARTGFRGDFYFIAQWFPKLGVYEAEGWNCRQFHASTEFYSDYGVYDVRLTVPERYVVGATGREIDRTANADGTATHTYRQADVHDFAWTASPHYRALRDRFEAPGLPPVDMRLLIQPEHLGQSDRHFDAARAALEAYGRWYGPYPYGHVTIVDPAYGSGAGGMEYPTLFTCGTRRFNPAGGDSPEGVTIHEMGHQFWYGIVGNNEFEHAWLDEGLNTFSTIRTLETFYDDRVLVRRYFEDFLPVRFPEIVVSRWQRRLQRHEELGTSDAMAKPSYLYYPASGAAISYDRTALWLATLERHLGWATLQRILSTFFERSRFRHPTPEEFFAVANEVAGRDLSWFFDQVHGNSVAFDYEISRAVSSRVSPRGWGDAGDDGQPIRLDDDEEPDGDELDAAEDDEEVADDEAVYRTEVVVRRLEEGRFPVDVRLVFEDDHEIRETWDGQERWKLVVVERPSRLRYAEVDPDSVLMLDSKRTNNSRMREPQGRLPAVKWAAKWMIWFQDRLNAFAWLM